MCRESAQDPPRATYRWHGYGEAETHKALRSMAQWELDSIDRLVSAYGDSPAARITSTPVVGLESCFKKTPNRPVGKVSFMDHVVVYED